MKIALWIRANNQPGVLRDITHVIFEHGGNIVYIEQFAEYDNNDASIYIEIEDLKEIPPEEGIIRDISNLKNIVSVNSVPTFNEVYGKRVIIIGGGAQVSEVAKGAISEADRHNIRGEKISVDTIPLVGEHEIANAVRAVARLPRAKIVILAGSIMGGEITKAVEQIKGKIYVVSLNMAGSVRDSADLVVTDPIQAGVMAVMAISEKAKFRIERNKGVKY